MFGDKNYRVGSGRIKSRVSGLTSKKKTDIVCERRAGREGPRETLSVGRSDLRVALTRVENKKYIHSLKLNSNDVLLKN